MKYFFFFAVLFITGFTAPSVFAQRPEQSQINYEYGAFSDLKNLKKVFIDTAGSVKDRESIVKEINSAKLGLELVEKPADAQIVLQFRGEKIEVVNGGMVIGNAVGVAREKQLAGKGMVFLPTNQPDTVRVILNFESQRDKYFEKKPVVKFVREFVEAYKAANLTAK